MLGKIKVLHGRLWRHVRRNRRPGFNRYGRSPNCLTVSNVEDVQTADDPGRSVISSVVTTVWVQNTHDGRQRDPAFFAVLAEDIRFQSPHDDGTVAKSLEE